MRRPLSWTSMKRALLYVPIVMAVMLASVDVASTTTPKPTTSTSPWTTAAPQGANLNGKMFTLSRNGGGISFYPPFSSGTTPWSYSTSYPTRQYPSRPYTRRPYTTTRRPYTTTRRPYTTTRRPYTTTTRRPYTTTPPPWTTAPSTRGVSVCLRYIADFQDASYPTVFTLSPSRGTQLVLRNSYTAQYQLYFGSSSYYSVKFNPNINFWSFIGRDIWTRVCLIVDTEKNVAQLFNGSNMSIRKMLPYRYVWSGEPRIDFSGFDGQVTDVQVWDYPLCYKEVFNYMTGSLYGQYRGSILTWSSISYSPRGPVLLEDAYEWQAKQPINRSKERGPQPNREKTKRFFNVRARKNRKREQL